MTRRTKAALVAGLMALGLIVARPVLALDGPYNSNPPYCRSHDAAYPLWWWYECMYPDPPDWGQVQ